MKQKIQIRHLPTPEELAGAAATEMLGLLMRRTSTSVPFGVALSGGRIAPLLYSAIVAGVKKSGVSLEEVHFFWADERCVPPDSAENNYAVARAHLFQPLGIPSANIHRIRGEVDPGFAVSEAEAELCRLMPLNTEGQPVLDVVVLGMGEDGHVASLFPEEGPGWIADQSVFRKVVATKPPPDRITLGYRPILAAREVLALVSGAGKCSAYHRLLAGDKELPITRVVAGRERTVIIQDLEKAAE